VGIAWWKANLSTVQMLQGGDAGGDAAIFANAAALATQQPQATALLVRAAQVQIYPGSGNTAQGAG
jgi:hypothetical protein